MMESEFCMSLLQRLIHLNTPPEWIFKLALITIKLKTPWYLIGFLYDHCTIKNICSLSLHIAVVYVHVSYDTTCTHR